MHFVVCRRLLVAGQNVLYQGHFNYPQFSLVFCPL